MNIYICPKTNRPCEITGCTGKFCFPSAPATFETITILNKPSDVALLESEVRLWKREFEAANKRIAELEAELLELKGKFSFVNDNFASVIKENGDLSRNLKAATALLEDISVYMNARADSIDGETPRPNTEMVFSLEISDLLEKIKK